MGEWEAQVAQSTSNCSQERLDRIDLLRSLTGKIEEIRYTIQVNYTVVGTYINSPVLRIHLILMRIRILDPHWKKWIRIQVISVTDIFKQSRNFKFFVLFFRLFLC